MDFELIRNIKGMVSNIFEKDSHLSDKIKSLHHYIKATDIRHSLVYSNGVDIRLTHTFSIVSWSESGRLQGV